MIEPVAEVVYPEECFETDLGVEEDLLGADTSECRGGFGILFRGSRGIKELGHFEEADDNLAVPEANGKESARACNSHVGIKRTGVEAEQAMQYFWGAKPQGGSCSTPKVGGKVLRCRG